VALVNGPHAIELGRAGFALKAGAQGEQLRVSFTATK
jgi:hypothetical protein